MANRYLCLTAEKPTASGGGCAGIGAGHAPKGGEAAGCRGFLRGNEKSYIYSPENTELAVAAPEMLGGAALTNLYRMDPMIGELAFLGSPGGATSAEEAQAEQRRAQQRK
jgi:hypothetical protein